MDLQCCPLRNIPFDRQDAGAGRKIEIGADAECLQHGLAIDLQADLIPDADLHIAGHPVPRIVEAGFEVADSRGNIGSPIEARQLAEDNFQAVDLLQRHSVEIEGMRHIAIAKGSHAGAVEEYLAVAVETQATQNPALALQFAPGNLDCKNPVTVIDPLALVGVEFLVPVGDDARMEQCLVHRARHLGGHRSDFGNAGDGLLERPPHGPGSG